MSPDLFNTVVRDAKKRANQDVIRFSAALTLVVNELPAEAIPKKSSSTERKKSGGTAPITGSFNQEVSDDLPDDVKPLYTQLKVADRKVITTAAHHRTLTSAGLFSTHLAEILRAREIAPDRIGFMIELARENKKSGSARIANNQTAIRGLHKTFEENSR